MAKKFKAATGALRWWQITLLVFAAADIGLSVDTAVANMAEALGKPVWLLNGGDSSCHWRTARCYSTWSARLRPNSQPRQGNWDTSLTVMVCDLADLVWVRGVERW